MIRFAPDRLTLAGLAAFLPGAYFAIRFFSGFVRVSYRKLRGGRPYLRGSATDYFLFAAGFALLALAGGILLAAAALQGGFQRFQDLEEVGSIRVTAPAAGRIHLEVELGEGHPAPRRLEADVAGVRWGLEGTTLRWRFGPRWLGFRSGHRIDSAHGTRLETGPPDRPPDSRAPVAAAYGAVELIRRHPACFPLAELTRRRTAWMPAAPGSYRLFIGNAGYVVVEARPEKEGDPAPAGPPAGLSSTRGESAGGDSGRSSAAPGR